MGRACGQLTYASTTVLRRVHRNRAHVTRVRVRATQWLMPESNICWPMGGEIDIMENLGNDMHRVHGALHWSHTQCGDAGEQNAGTWSPSFPYSFGTDFHVFGIGTPPSPPLVPCSHLSSCNLPATSPHGA